MAHIRQEFRFGTVGGLGGSLGRYQLQLGPHAIGDVARDAVNLVAKLLSPPFQGSVVTILMPIAVDETQHGISRPAGLHLHDVVQGAQ